MPKYYFTIRLKNIVSLKSLFEGNLNVDGENTLDIDKFAYLVCRGGWPQATGLKTEAALQQAFDYYDAVVKSDIK